MGNNASNEDIIVKCSLEEMIKGFFKDYVIVWHDPGLNSQENQHTLRQLEKFCQVFTFTEWQKASAFIKEKQEICHVVTSGTNGELLVKEISEAQSVSNIYVFCRNRDFHLSWARNYQKVSCVETKIKQVLTEIQQHLLYWYKEKSSLKLNLPAFAPIFNDSDKSEMNNLHRCLKVIPNFKNRLQAKQDFINLSKGIYTDPNNTKFIANFEKYYNEYNKSQTFRWYTRESFLYKVTNNCLRIATADSIQYCRLLLKDIEQAIKEQYKTKSKNFHGLLHRGSYLSFEEWSSLKENVGREIEMHGFLSVSKDKNIALQFFRQNPSKMVLITIIVPKGPNEEEQGFAEMEEYSLYPLEKEILFNVRSRFTVLETEDEYSEELPYRHLVLLYGAQGFRRHLTEQNPTIEVVIPNIENVSCADCKASAQKLPGKYFFVSMKEGRQECYCVKCVDNASEVTPFLCVPLENQTPHSVRLKGCFLMNSPDLPMYGYQCSKCQAKKLKAYFSCTDCQKRWCKECFLEEAPSCIETQHHNIILETKPLIFWFTPMSATELSHLKYLNESITNNDIDEVFQQAEMYFANHKYEKAIEFYTLYIQQRGTRKNDPWLAVSYKHIGMVYTDKKEYEKALEYNFKAQEIFKAVYGENSEAFATSCANIGLAYSYQGEEKKALEYYFKSLEVYKLIFGENHSHVATVETNIGLAYCSLRDYAKSLEYYLRALQVRKSLFGENHPHVATSYSNIGLLYENSGEYHKALDYYSKTLEIRKAVYGENHPLVALAFVNSALTYSSLGDKEKSLEYNLRALEIRKSLFKENHPDVAESYDQIGFLYESQGEYEKGLEYHWKSLKVKKAIHGGENYPLVAHSYSNLGYSYLCQKDYKKALEYYLKSLEMRKAIHGEIHPDVNASYLKIGDIYYDQEEYNKALENYLKCAEIEKILYGENHADFASSLYNIGYVYYIQQENDKALEYLTKSLTIRESLFGENHSMVAICYNSIGLIYDNLKDHKKSLEYHMKSLHIRRQTLGENHADIAMSYNNIGLAYDYQEEYEKGLEYHLKSLDIKIPVYGEKHSLVGDTYKNIGYVYSKLGQYKKALEYHSKAEEIYKSIYGDNHYLTTKVQNWILEIQKIDQQQQ